MRGCQWSSVEMISCVVMNNVHLNINTIVYDDKTPLIAAITSTESNESTLKLEVIRSLIQHGADFNYSGHCTSPLLAAVGIEDETESLAIVQVLIEHGADVNKAVNYETPVMRAIRMRHEAVVRVLLEHGADMNEGYGEIDGSYMESLIAK